MDSEISRTVMHDLKVKNFSFIEQQQQNHIKIIN